MTPQPTDRLLQIMAWQLAFHAKVTCRLVGHRWLQCGIDQRVCERCSTIDGDLTEEEYAEAHEQVLRTIQRFEQESGWQ